MIVLKRTIIGLLVVIFAAVLWLRYQTANAVWVYHERADFEEMPANDDGLREWLAAAENAVATR